MSAGGTGPHFLIKNKVPPLPAPGRGNGATSPCDGWSLVPHIQPYLGARDALFVASSPEWRAQGAYKFALSGVWEKLCCLTAVMARERFVGISGMLGGGNLNLGPGNARWWPVQGSIGGLFPPLSRCAPLVALPGLGSGGFGVGRCGGAAGRRSACWGNVPTADLEERWALRAGTQHSSSTRHAHAEVSSGGRELQCPVASAVVRTGAEGLSSGPSFLMVNLKDGPRRVATSSSVLRQTTQVEAPHAVEASAAGANAE